MKTNIKYRSHDGKFSRKYEGLPMWMGVVFVWSLLYMLLRYIFQGEMLSPAVYSIPTKAYASEEVTISCDNPKGYLECQVYKGIITWKDYDILSKLIKCESNWNPEALNKNKNGTFDAGLLQINDVHKQKRSEMLDFKKNIDFGIKLYKKQGVNPWTCKKYI